jgi:hypothetical protein
MGYPISKKLYGSFADVADRPFRLAPACPTLLLTVSLMDRPAVSLTRYHDLLKSKAAPVELSHLAVEPFWDRYWRWECPEVEKATLLWAVNHLSAGDLGGKSGPVPV